MQRHNASLGWVVEIRTQGSHHPVLHRVGGRWWLRRRHWGACGKVGPASLGKHNLVAPDIPQHHLLFGLSRRSSNLSIDQCGRGILLVKIYIVRDCLFALLLHLGAQQPERLWGSALYLLPRALLSLLKPAGCIVGG